MPDAPLKTPDGKSVEYVPAEKVQFFKDQGYSPVSSGEQGAITTKPEARGTGLTGAVVSGVTAGLSGLTAGGSDLAARALLSPDSVDYIRQARENHPIANVGGNIVGTVLGAAATGGANVEAEGAGLAAEGANLLSHSPAAAISRLGGRVAEGAGGGIVGGIKAGAAEGAAYGAGNAVSELALSNDPLTAEHIGSALSSNMLLGAGLGGVGGGLFKAGERALSRAGNAIGEASAAKAAIAGVPEDLAGLDAAGLREAAVTERKAIEAAKAEEIASLQEQRIPLRKQAADDVRALHDDLALEGERPIYKSISTKDLGSVLPELKGIEGVQTAQVALADSFKTLRRQLRNSVAVADDPGSLVKTLQMRQGALETLQAKAPEIAEALGGNTGALVHVDSALAETKEQIARIQSLGRGNPVSSAKLTDLKAGVTPRLKAIEAAQDALKNAPEKGWLQKSAEGGAFAGGTALAHMIPGVGIAAPFVGKYASEAVGRLFSRLAEHGAESAAKTASAADSFLSAAKGVKPTAFLPTAALAAVRFAPSSVEATGREKLPELFKARSAEIRSQTQFAPDGSVQMRPEARAEMSKRLDPIASVNPLLADKLETLGARKIAFISSKIPRKPEVDGIQIGPDKWQPSDMQMASWARTIHAVENPDEVEKHLAAGYLTPEEGEAYRAVYPERFAALQQKLTQAAPTLAKTIPYARRLAWSNFAGVPIDASMAPNVLTVLQGTFTKPAPDTTADIPGMQAPKIKPSFGSLGSMKSLDKPTPAQDRASRG